MNREDIIRMAWEASTTDFCYFPQTISELERFAALVAAAEREACAKIADGFHVPMCDTAADAIATAIRARG